MRSFFSFRHIGKISALILFFVMIARGVAYAPIARGQTSSSISLSGQTLCSGTSTQNIRGCSYAGNANEKTFIVFVADRYNVGVTGIQGYGISWKKVLRACSGRNQQGIEAWIAQGTGQAGSLDISFEKQVSSASVHVVWYEGVDTTNPLVSHTFSNTNGQESMSCVNGLDTTTTRISIPGGSPSSLIVLGTNSRTRTIRTAPSGFTQRGMVASGASGNLTRLYTHDRFVSAGTYAGNAGLSGTADWAQCAIVLRPRTQISRTPTMTPTHSPSISPTGTVTRTPTLSPSPTGIVLSPTPTSAVLPTATLSPTPTTVVVPTITIPPSLGKVYQVTRDLLQNGSVNDSSSWLLYQSGYTHDPSEGKNAAGSIKAVVTSDSQESGAYQRIDLKQTTRLPVTLKGYIKGNNINKTGWFGASLYAEIHLTDGSVVYWNSAPNTGTFDWRQVGVNLSSVLSVTQPIDHIFVVPILADSTSGEAWFDDISLTEYQSNGSAVTIMVDDGEITTLTAQQIMAAKGFLGSAPIPSALVGTTDYLTIDQVKALRASGWEIMGHGITHSDMSQMTGNALIQELSQPIQFFQGHGIQIKNVAYPYGAYNGEVVSRVQQYYRSGRAYELGSNGGGSWPYDIKVRSLEETTTLADVQGWVQDVLNNKRWLILVGHRFAASGDDKYVMTPATFTAIVQYLSDIQIPVVTYDQGLDMFGL